MDKTKKKKKKPTCSVEQAINAVKWDKHSLWTSLVNKAGLKPWKTPDLAGEKK